MESTEYQLRQINKQLNPLPLFIKLFVKATLWSWVLIGIPLVLYKLFGN